MARNGEKELPDAINVQQQMHEIEVQTGIWLIVVAHTLTDVCSSRDAPFWLL